MARRSAMGSLVVAMVSCGLLAACGDETSDAGGAGGTTGDGGAGAAGAGSNGGAEPGGAPGNGGAGGAGECLAFGSDCAAGDACCDAAGETGECFAFGMGSRCTIPCPADPMDCPNDGEGCNSMNPSYCKPPL